MAGPISFGNAAEKRGVVVESNGEGGPLTSLIGLTTVIKIRNPSTFDHQATTQQFQ
jgi:hypothetical protein